MSNIDLGEVAAAGMANGIWATRAKAIQAYANLEGSLCMLFSALTGMDQDTSHIVFFKITSQDVRNKILEKLLRKKVEEKYRPCMTNTLTKLRPLDRKRNELVHWNTVAKVSRSTGTVSVVLHPPANKLNPMNSDEVTEDGMFKFIYECSFYSSLVNMFHLVMFQPGLPADFERESWLDIFQQQVVYPPPTTHPLYGTQKELNNLLQSFLMTD